MGVDEGLRRARIQEGDTAEFHGNEAAVDVNFDGEGRVVDRYYTGDKTMPLLGEQGRALTGLGGEHHGEDIAAVVRTHF